MKLKIIFNKNIVNDVMETEYGHNEPTDLDRLSFTIDGTILRHVVRHSPSKSVCSVLYMTNGICLLPASRLITWSLAIFVALRNR